MGSQFASTLVLSVALLGAPTPPSVVPALEAAGPATTDLSADWTFRHQFGLAAESATIAAVNSSNRVSPDWGVALTDSEEALMNRRAEIPAELASIRAYGAKNRGSWGGLWLSYPVGGSLAHALTVNASTTGDAASTRRALSSLVPQGADLSVELTKHAQSDLDSLHQQLASSDVFRANGTDLLAASTMVAGSYVEVVVDHVTPGLLVALTERYGDTVEVVEGTPTRPDACSRTSCGPSWRGGIKIARPGPAYCTLGFNVAVWAGVWQYALFTAGHCGSATWRQGTTSGTVVGTASQNHIHDATPVDVQVIIPAQPSTQTNQYLDGTASCTTCVLRSITVTQGHNADEAGDAVCNHGAYSGTSCGAIVTNNYTFVWADEGVTLYHMRRATYTRIPGDSGGPVTAAANTAAGSHTHYVVIGGRQYAVYAHVWDMEQATGWLIWHG